MMPHQNTDVRDSSLNESIRDFKPKMNDESDDKETGFWTDDGWTSTLSINFYRCIVKRILDKT